MLIPLFNFKEIRAKELMINTKIGFKADNAILYQSTNSDEMFWKEKSNKNIFQMFNECAIPYTYLLCICYENECKIILGPFDIKYIKWHMRKMVFEKYILDNIRFKSKNFNAFISISNIGRVLEYSRGTYTINTLYRVDIGDEIVFQNKKITDKWGQYIYSDSFLRETISNYVKGKLNVANDIFGNYNSDYSLYQNIKNNKLFVWGLIGNAMITKYSLAPIMWKELFKKMHLPITYKVIHTEKSNKLQYLFDNELKKIGTLGFNVAMPWKKWAFAQCQYTNTMLKRIQTVNTIYREKDIICGDNTDGIGLIRVIEKYLTIKNKVFLILGAGGVVQTLPFLLSQYDAHEIYIYDIDKLKAEKLVSREVNIVERQGTKLKQITFEEIICIAENVDVVVNGTTCGMYGSEDEMAINEAIISNMKKCKLVVEAIYNPYITKLLKCAASRKIEIVSGVELLISQANFSFKNAFGFELAE